MRKILIPILSLILSGCSTSNVVYRDYEVNSKGRVIKYEIRKTNNLISDKEAIEMGAPIVQTLKNKNKQF